MIKSIETVARTMLGFEGSKNPTPEDLNKATVENSIAKRLSAYKGKNIPRLLEWVQQECRERMAKEEAANDVIDVDDDEELSDDDEAGTSGEVGRPPVPVAEPTAEDIAKAKATRKKGTPYDPNINESLLTTKRYTHLPDGVIMEERTRRNYPSLYFYAGKNDRGKIVSRSWTIPAALLPQKELVTKSVIHRMMGLVPSNSKWEYTVDRFEQVRLRML